MDRWSTGRAFGEWRGYWVAGRWCFVNDYPALPPAETKIGSLGSRFWMLPELGQAFVAFCWRRRATNPIKPRPAISMA